jgi:putative transposase
MFQQKTKSKCIDNGSIHYGPTVFHYVHQNAYAAGLVEKIENWQYSLLMDYLGLRSGDLCNKALAFLLFDLQKEKLLEETYNLIPDLSLKHILKAGS